MGLFLVYIFLFLGYNSRSGILEMASGIGRREEDREKCRYIELTYVIRRERNEKVREGVCWG